MVGSFLLQCGVLEFDASRRLEGCNSNFSQSSVGGIPTASYRLVDTIKEEQALTELTVVELEAGSRHPDESDV